MSDVSPQAPNEFAGLAPAQIRSRYVLFYGVFVVFLLIYFGTVVAIEMDQTGLTVPSLLLVKLLSPLVPANNAFVGGLVPALFGGVIAALSKPQDDDIRFTISLIVSGLVYVLFFHAADYFQLGEDGLPLNQKITSRVSAHHEPLEFFLAMTAFAQGVCGFAAFVFASLIGVRTAFGPKMRGRTGTTDVSATEARPDRPEPEESAVATPVNDREG